MFLHFADVNHISRPRKQKVTSLGSKDYARLWLVDLYSFCLFLFFKVCLLYRCCRWNWKKTWLRFELQGQVVQKLKKVQKLNQNLASIIRLWTTWPRVSVLLKGTVTYWHTKGAILVHLSYIFFKGLNNLITKQDVGFIWLVFHWVCFVLENAATLWESTT